MPKLDALEILALINNPAVEFIQIRLYREASIKELIKAVRLSSSSHERAILFYVLGQRRARSALSLIAEGLTDPSPQVRSQAADVLSGLGNPIVVGPVLYNAFLSEVNPEAKSGFAYALGMAKYRDAVPALIEALKDHDEHVKDMAAWALGYMGTETTINEIT